MFDNNKADEINFRSIFDLIDQKQVFIDVFGLEGIPNNSSIKIISPVRSIDKEPTVSFKWTDGKLRMRDWHFDIKEGTFDCIDAVCHVYNFSPIQALTYIKNKYIYGLSDSQRTAIVRNNREMKKRTSQQPVSSIWDFSLSGLKKKDYQFFYVQGIIDPKTLRKFKVNKLLRLNINGYLIYCYNKSIDNFAFLYFIGNDKIAYFPTNRKGSKFPKFRMSSSNFAQGWEQLPEEGKFVVITTSLKDVMLLFELGIPAIAGPSESIMITDKHMNGLLSRFKSVYVLMGRDRAGDKATIRYRNKNCLPLRLPKHWSNDLTDTVRSLGREYVSNEVYKAKALL